MSSNDRRYLLIRIIAYEKDEGLYDTPQANTTYVIA